MAELDWQNQYYAAMLDNEPYCYLHVQTVPEWDHCLLHITLLRFGRRVLRECLADYVELQRLLKDQGIRYMVHIKDAPYRQWQKLMRVLGFGPEQDVEINGRPYKRIIMEVA